MKHQLPLICLVFGAPLWVHADPDTSRPPRVPQAGACDQLPVIHRLARQPSWRLASRPRPRPVAAQYVGLDTTGESSWDSLREGEVRRLDEDGGWRAADGSRPASLNYNLGSGHMAASVGLVSLSPGDAPGRRLDSPAGSILPRPSSRILGGSLRLAF